MLIKWTWTGDSLPSKKNSKKIIRKKSRYGKTVPIIVSSDAFTKWNAGFVSDIKMLKPIGSWKSATFFFWNPDNRVFDLSNKLESIMDGMVDAGYIVDDSYRYCPDIRVVYCGTTDRKEWNVSAEIEIAD